MKSIPRKIADPEAIYKDNSSGNLVFRYGINKLYDAKAVFIPGRNLTSLVLHTFFKVRQGNLMKIGAIPGFIYENSKKLSGPGFEPGSFMTSPD